MWVILAEELLASPEELCGMYLDTLIWLLGR